MLILNEYSEFPLKKRKAACLQMVSKDTVSQNLDRIKAIIDNHDKDYDLLVLPENFAMITKDQHALRQISESIGDGPIQNFLSQLAHDYQLWLVGGSIVLKDEKSENLYSAALVYAPNGDCVACHRKRHLFNVRLSEKESYSESTLFSPGKMPPIVIETDLGRLGVIICYELRFAENFLALVESNVEIIAVPSAFTQKTGEAHWLSLLRSRAIETQSYVLGSNQGGLHGDRMTFGHSAIYDPDGREMAMVEYGEALIKAEIDHDRLRSVREMLGMAQARLAID